MTILAFETLKIRLKVQKLDHIFFYELVEIETQIHVLSCKISVPASEAVSNIVKLRPLVIQDDHIQGIILVLNQILHWSTRGMRI